MDNDEVVRPVQFSRSASSVVSFDDDVHIQTFDVDDGGSMQSSQPECEASAEEYDSDGSTISSLLGVSKEIECKAGASILNDIQKLPRKAFASTVRKMLRQFDYYEKNLHTNMEKETRAKKLARKLKMERFGLQLLKMVAKLKPDTVEDKPISRRTAYGAVKMIGGKPIQRVCTVEEYEIDVLGAVSYAANRALPVPEPINDELNDPSNEYCLNYPEQKEKFRLFLVDSGIL